MPNLRFELWIFYRNSRRLSALNSLRGKQRYRVRDTFESKQSMSQPSAAERGLVVSAQSADLVWRAGGAIALYAKHRWQIKVVCPSFGERGRARSSGKIRAGRSSERAKSARPKRNAPRIYWALWTLSSLILGLPSAYGRDRPGKAGRYFLCAAPALGAYALAP